MQRSSLSVRATFSVALTFAACALAAPVPVRAGSPNDNFANAITIKGLPVQFRSLEGSLPDDTTEPGEPDHAGAGAGKSRWWRWVAPESAHVAVQTCSS